MIHRIIDTNVAIVANGSKTHASEECQLACITALEEIVSNGLIYLDDLNLILDEYSKKLTHFGQPGVGDAFYTHVCQNIGNVEKCVKFPINEINDSFEEFPNDAKLEKFDNDDRKFVAVCVSANKVPIIINAVDTRSWPVFKDTLKNHGINIIELCPKNL